MRRLPAFFPFVLCFLALALGTLHLRALTEEEKRKLFLKAREEMKTVPDDASPTPTPRPKPKPAPHKGSPTPKPRPKISPRPAREEEATPRPRRPSPTATERPSQREEEAEPTPRERPRPTAAERPVATPQPTPAPTPPPTPTPRSTPQPTISYTPPAAPITVSKTGLGKEEYEEAPPAPKRSLFGWFQRDNYVYLTPAIRAEIDRARVRKNRWRYIVVHNSGSRQGNAKIFDYYHKHVRKMPNGLAYHFVIGNGTSTGNGQIEIGGRWKKQLDGGHVHSDYLNSISLGICLVGDFNRGQPSKEQLAATEELIRYLRRRCGKVDGKVPIVYPHKRINPPRWSTDCPGDHFPYDWFRRFPEK